MRPVNLIPPEERRDKRTVRTGPIAYLLVGSLALALAAVTLLVLTENKISDRKAEITKLQAQEAAAQQRANELAPFAQFASLEEQRTATVKSLADSRFDWERVMRELALVMPSDIWLIELSGSAGSSDSAAVPAAPAGGETSVPGAPSLTLKGCATGQESVARFLAALRDIDGVTRVGLIRSERPTGDSISPTGGGEESGADCRTRDFIPLFEILVAFDAVPAPVVPGAAPAPTAPAPTTAPETTPASDTTATSGGS
jgi:Tfp pilus assembly protein PilN